jgi:hypothetical protein
MGIERFRGTLAIFCAVILVELATSPMLATSQVAPSPTYSVATNLDAAILLPAVRTLNATSGNVESIPYVATLYNGTKLSVPATLPSTQSQGAPLAACQTYILYCRSYMGGYMTSNGCQPNQYCTGTAAKAEISFPSTSHTVIPAGNFLEGTINLQGQDTTLKGTDYLMRAAHVLYPYGQHGLVADMWQDCEGVLFQCGNPYATELLAFILIINGLSDNTPIWVQIQTTSTSINWLYSYDGLSWATYQSYTPPSTFKHNVYLGTANCINGPLYLCLYYQFGVWAQQAFYGPDNSFKVMFQYPSYLKSGSWYTIPTAYSVWGPHTYFDQTWVLAQFTWGLSAAYPNTFPIVTFYYTSSGYLPENVRLWG